MRTSGEGFRLACQTTVFGSGEVQVAPLTSESAFQILTASGSEALIPAPILEPGIWKVAAQVKLSSQRGPADFGSGGGVGGDGDGGIAAGGAARHGASPAGGTERSPRVSDRGGVERTDCRNRGRRYPGTNCLVWRSM